MGGAIERREAGSGGPFPLRFPVGKLAAFMIAAALTPLWWTIGQARAPALQQFYSGTYWTSLRDSYHTGRNGQPVTVVYPIQIEQGPLGPSLATVEEAERFPDRLRTEDRAVNPKLFHAWLRDQVYQGSALNIYGFLVTAVTITFLVLLMIGANIDRRRRLSALEGAHRRGTKGVSWQSFNRAELGPLWLLWMILFWRGRSTLPGCGKPCSGAVATLPHRCVIRLPPATRRSCSGSVAFAGRPRKDRGSASRSVRQRGSSSVRSCSPITSTYSAEPGEANQPSCVTCCCRSGRVARHSL